MAKGDRPNFLKAWRKFRGYTQEQLADRVEPPTTKQVIAALESGERGLSDKWLRKLGAALNIMPGFILDHDPENMPTDILDIWAQIPEENREQAARVLEAFRRTGTEG